MHRHDGRVESARSQTRLGSFVTMGALIVMEVGAAQAQVTFAPSVSSLTLAPGSGTLMDNGGLVVTDTATGFTVKGDVTDVFPRNGNNAFEEIILT